MPFGNRKNILKDLFTSVFSQFKEYRPSGNLKFHYLSIFQSFKIAYFNGKNPNFSYDKVHSKYFWRLWVKHREKGAIWRSTHRM